MEATNNFTQLYFSVWVELIQQTELYNMLCITIKAHLH